MIFINQKNMSQISSENPQSKALPEESFTPNKNKQKKIQRKDSLNTSSDSESFSTIIKEEIKNLIENDDNISFSSESEQESPYKKEDLDYLLESRFWREGKNYDKEYKLIKNIKEESNKQSTQGNEDEEMRNEHNNTSSESNSPLHTFINNETSENDSNHSSESKKMKESNKIKENNNLKGTNLLINRPNLNNNINFNNINAYPKCIFPYEQINYITNQNGSNFYPGYLPNNFGNYNINYNLPSQNNNNNLISMNNTTNKLSKLLNETNDINNKKDIKNSTKENSPKLNVNMTYYPKLQNSEITTNKQSINNKTINTNNSNTTTEIKSVPNKSNKNTQDKKANNNKDNLSPNEIKNISNNNKNSKENNNKINQTYIKPPVNNNININNKNTKCEKLVLNLDDIASGKDTRTTIMIRNIPIKYTDGILNDTFKEFHGKYDCLYMPYDYEKKGNKGYAFINFINPLHILLFYEKFNGKKWIHFESPKICELNMAHFQGINEIQKHAKNYKELKKSCNTKANDKIVIPIKYLSKLKKRFPKMKFSENSKKNEFEILSFN